MDSVQYNESMETPLPAIGYLINRISRLNQRWLDTRLKRFGVSAAAIPVLAILKTEGIATQQELASRIGIEQPTMALLLKRMERDQLIVRSANPEDARSAHVALTQRAMRSLPAARKELQRGYELTTSEFSKEELSTLTRLLERYLASVEKHGS